MARNLSPSIKKSRRFGVDLGHKQNSQKVARRLTVPPGQHGQRKRRGRRPSEYGQQLAEKQKVKFIYGILEKQFAKYVKTAKLNPQATGEELLRLLERRLDNAVFRLNFAPTRAMARQLITHGHILINNKKVTIPSYQVNVNNIIMLSPTAAGIPDVLKRLEQKDIGIPKWMQKKALAGKIHRLPGISDIDSGVNDQLIVEFYSR
jgi:small subunit ribosomal protein S4